MNIQLTAQIWKKGRWFIAHCPELDFVSQGRTPEEAQVNLAEVVELQFEEMARMETLHDYLEECGYRMTKKKAIPSSEMVGFRKMAMQVCNA